MMSPEGHTHDQQLINNVKRLLELEEMIRGSSFVQ